MELNGLGNIHAMLMMMKDKLESGNQFSSIEFDKIESEIFLFRDYLLFINKNGNKIDWAEFKAAQKGK